MKTLLVGLLAILSTSAFAGFEAVEAIVEGDYVTKGKSPFKDSSLHIQRWAEEYVLTAERTQGELTFQMEARFQHSQKNEFEGFGEVTVVYPNGKGCRHKMAAKLYAYSDKVFYKENTPETMPYNPNGPCTAAGPYIWAAHPNAYELKAE